MLASGGRFYSTSNDTNKMVFTIFQTAYHWVEMWNTLQGLVKFLQANAKVFQSQPEARDLVAEVTTCYDLQRPPCQFYVLEHFDLTAVFHFYWIDDRFSELLCDIRRHDYAGSSKSLCFVL